MDEKENEKRKCSCKGINTSTSCNRQILFGSSVILFVLAAVILSQAINILHTNVLFTTVYTSAKNTGVLIIVCAGCFALNSILGFVAAFYRNGNLVKVFLLFTFLLIAFQSVCSVLLASNRHQDQLVVQETEFRQGWIDVIAQIVSGNDESGKYMEFISSITTGGKCCGFDSTNSPLQNPPGVRCKFETVCQEYLSSEIDSKISHLLSMYLVLLILTFLVFVQLVAFLVRIIPQPVYHEDPGGYYSV